MEARRISKLRLARDLLMALARPRPGQFAWVLGLTAAGAVAQGAGLALLVPLLQYLGIERGATATGSLAGALAGYVALVAAAALVLRLRATGMARLRLTFVDGLRLDLHRAVLGMAWPAFQGLRSTDLKQTLTGEIGRLGVAVDALLSLAVALLGIPVLLVVAFRLSPALTVGGLAAAVLAGLLVQRLGRHGFRLGTRMGDAGRAMMADLSDDLAGLRLIKMLGAEERRAEVMRRRFGDLRQNQLDHAGLLATERALLLVAAAVVAAVDLVVALQVMALPLAGALVLIVTQGRLLQMLLQALSDWRRLEGMLPALVAYRATLAGCLDAAEPPAEPAPPLCRALRLAAVSVAYGPGRPALTAVDAVIPAGGVTAVIGASGAGKSTLADLAAGLRGPDGGAVELDGTPLTPALRRGWRDRVGVVPQDPFLLHDTIRENLLMARPGAREEQLWQALEDAALAVRVRAMPHGLDTVVGDRGARLSGGERQRVALAGALLRAPSLLVLDEATSALDAETERLVTETIGRLRGRMTVLVVAHRPSTVRGADHVLLLEDGRLAAAGCWEEVREAAGVALRALDMEFGFR